jgi:oxygen-independent coproporphyrinogen-3 oxidase
MPGVYIHVPFCKTLCPYCDFVRQPFEPSAAARYVGAACAEMGRYDGPRDAATVYLGGGTPSLLQPRYVEDLLAAVHQTFALTPDAEVTIEANPDDVTPSLVDAWRALGINRVSLGAQSFDDATLAYLGRRHDAALARDACTLVAERFENWSLDLIYGAHPAAAWPATLTECRRFDPPHVSAYGLTYEPGTPFGDRTHEALTDDAVLTLYQQTVASLEGMRRYEVSNFARPGFESRHNRVYWRNEAYAGIGPGAYGFDGSVRARNATSLEAYLARPGEKEEALPLSSEEIRVETLIQHFRLAAGLSESYYAERFSRSLMDDYGDALTTLRDRGLLERTPDGWRPTAAGFELNNEIGLALV